MRFVLLFCLFIVSCASAQKTADEATTKDSGEAMVETTTATDKEVQPEEKKTPLVDDGVFDRQQLLQYIENFGNQAEEEVQWQANKKGDFFTVKKTSEGSFLSRAGLEPGDIIFRVNGSRIHGFELLKQLKTEKRRKYKLTFRRGNKISDTTIEISELKEEMVTESVPVKKRLLLRRSKLLSILDDLYEGRNAVELGAASWSYDEAGDYYTVETVPPGSPLKEWGLQPGDVISRVNSQPIQGHGIRQQIEQGATAYLVEISRGEERFAISVTIR